MLFNTESLHSFTSCLLAFFHSVLFSSGYTFIYIKFILLGSGTASAIASVNVECGFGLVSDSSIFASIRSSFLPVSKPINSDRNRKRAKLDTFLLRCPPLSWNDKDQLWDASAQSAISRGYFLPNRISWGALLPPVCLGVTDRDMQPAVLKGAFV